MKPSFFTNNYEKMGSNLSSDFNFQSAEPNNEILFIICVILILSISVLPWTHRKSSSQTSYHSSGHQKGTRWCQFDTLTWRSPVECRCRSQSPSPLRWSGMSHQTFHLRWKICCIKFQNPFELWIDFYYCESLPIVHKDVWFPNIP